MFLAAVNESVVAGNGVLYQLLDSELWQLMVTILSGVFVYVLSQLFTEFILRPIQEYKQLKAKVAKFLVLHAQYYSNPRFYDESENCPAWSVASNEIRELAAEVAAFAEIKPCHLWVFLAIPRKKKLLEAQSYLIGLSNSFFTTRNGEGRCVDRVYEYPDIIRQNMGIAPKRQKKKR